MIIKILDIILPPRSSFKIVAECKLDDLLKHYKPTTHEGIEYLLPYQEPTIKALLNEAKFYNNHKAHRLLNALLFHYLSERYSNLPIIIPIPLSRQRQKQRGHNQVVSILSTNQIIKKQIIMALTKKIDTRPQTSLDKSNRKNNVRGAFIVDKNQIKNYPEVVVIDDVTTTSSTLKEAEKTIVKNLPVKVRLLALAH